MLYADALRGFDSTGVIAVDRDGSYSIMKEAVEATWFGPQLQASPVGRKMYQTGKAFIGHNRKKTVGTIKDETAHPFVVDNTFAMVHNGTLYNHKTLADTDVDSQALTAVFKQAFDLEEPLKAMEETLGKVNGAYAVAMYDQKRDKVMFLRNKERPLFLIETPNAWYFCSEGMMGTWILTRNDYKYADLKVSLIPEHTLVTYDLVKNTMHEDVLVPKKALSPTPHTVAGIGKASGGKMSKSAFKFFKRNWLGRRISFWVDDYVEANYPLTEEQGETEMLLFARCEEILQMHSIASQCDIKKCGLDSAQDIFDTRWTSTIEDIEYHDKTESVTIYCALSKPVLPSRGAGHGGNKEHEIPVGVNRTQFEASLKPKSLAVLEREYNTYKVHLQPWQCDCYEVAIKERSLSVADLLKNYHKLGYDAVFDEAKKEGIKLIEERKDGKVTLTHPTKGLVYEAPIVVH